MMKTPVRHYIITRFNIPWGRFGRGENPIGLQPAYLEERFDVFERYTIPSMEAQTVKDFSWLVLFDERTPQPFLDRIEGYKKYPFFVAVYGNTGFSLKDFTQDLIEKARADGVSCVITSRTDNDDALMPDYVKIVQERAKSVFPKDRYLTSPQYYQYDIKDRTLTSHRLKKNHFISRTGNVFEGMQGDLPLNPSMYVKIPGRYSIEIIHGSNVINSAKYFPGCCLPRSEYETVKSLYSLDLPDYDIYRAYCKKKIKENCPENVKSIFAKIPGIIKKIF